MLIKQVTMLIGAITIMIILSFLSKDQIRRFGILLFGLAFTMVVLTHLIGVEVKGAQRWLGLFGLTFQPTEILKPSFAIIIAWVISSRFKEKELPSFTIAFIIYGLVAITVVTQPDFGQTFILTSIFVVILFLGGWGLKSMILFALLGFFAVFRAYHNVSYFKNRIDGFLFVDHSSVVTQSYTAQRAFASGGLFGTGPGEGAYKNSIPDGHNDYIFAVIGEEFGLVACTILMIALAGLIFRAFYKTLKLNDIFAQLASMGLITQFCLQSVINMATALSIIPPKGMTFPFLSFGGSSVLATGVTLGMILALTRKEQ